MGIMVGKFGGMVDLSGNRKKVKKDRDGQKGG